MNTYGQTKFTLNKQMQIEEIVKKYKCDIVHLQESHIEDHTFDTCSFIKNNYYILRNNSMSEYGTASLIHNDFKVENECYDSNGRVIVFDIQNVTFCNVYLEAGTDALSRAAREKYCGELLPNLLVNRWSSGCIGGDWNNIIDKKDATNNASSKMSPNLARVVKTFNWCDSYRATSPVNSVFSHYYKDGATRIDRQYSWGEALPELTEYIPLAFSDRFGLFTVVNAPIESSRPKYKYSPKSFKIRNNVSCDPLFKKSVASEMIEWKKVKDCGLDTLTWWELVVKPGIKRIAMSRDREIKVERRGELNMLLIRQAYIVKKLHKNPDGTILTDLKYTQARICSWFEEESRKVQVQSRKEKFAPSEVTRIYHHELHKQYIKRSMIDKLETEEGLLTGHEKCSQYLHKTVRDLFGHTADLDASAQNALLNLLSPVFSNEDNLALEALPSKDEILQTLSSSNFHASAGSDGITSLVYKECWDALGDSIMEVIRSLFMGALPTVSMRTAIMKFCSKPKKPGSIKPSDKRRISILNCDFKLFEGLLARRFRKVGYRVLSPLQYVAGHDRTIHHGIARARDAIEAATRTNIECGIGDQDYIAAFDFLVLSWVWLVLERKGVNAATIFRLKNLYANGITIPVVNNIPMKAIYDVRGSLRQGGSGSMEWFAFGIDPLLIYLEQNLEGILISRLPVIGPANVGDSFPLPPKEERFKGMAFCDDVKPAICNLNEFLVADKGAEMFERAAGTKLHRNPLSNKCKFLPLGKWRTKLRQEDIPTAYMRLTDTLDMVGVKLCATWSKSRKLNGDDVQQKVSALMRCWRSGKFMPLSLRPLSANTYALSKVWFRCATVNLRESDFSSINSSLKRWIYSDLLLKPEELILFRPVKNGGLGLSSVKHKSLAFLIKTFLEMAMSSTFIKSQYLTMLFRSQILEEDILCPPLPPYFTASFFATIKKAKYAGCDIGSMSTRDWYRYLLNDDILNIVNEDGSFEKRLCRSERLFPDIDWEATWQRAKLPVLSSKTMSFLFQLLHDLLTSEERLSRTVGGSDGKCRFNCSSTVADIEHCFFFCIKSREVGSWLQRLVRENGEGAASEINILKLNVVDNSAVIWIVANTHHFIWSKRSVNKKADITTCLAVLNTEALILKETQDLGLGIQIVEMLRQN